MFDKKLFLETSSLVIEDKAIICSQATRLIRNIENSDMQGRIEELKEQKILVEYIDLFMYSHAPISIDE